MYYMNIEASVEWSWGIALPLLAIVVLMGLGIPMWVSMGIGVSALLIFTGTLPLSLLGETLFEGMDAFALLAVPLFILTCDALVRT
ncbi:MAG: TRAP transporter large permease subunit, partial [Burkholderiaceae bacterium]